MRKVTKESIEAGALVLGIIAVLWLAFRTSSAQTGIVASTEDEPENFLIDHAGEAGNDYWNYNYPSVQGSPFTIFPNIGNGRNTGGCGPTCGCSQTQLLGTNDEFQRYLQTRLTAFVDRYEQNVLSFLPSWFTQYLYNTGPGLSRLPAIEV